MKPLFSSSIADQHAARRKGSAQGLAAFGIDAEQPVEADGLRTIRESSRGEGPTIFTVGYERRDGEDLIGRLLDAGVETLIDVRQRAMSRKPDFRSKALEVRCEAASIEYVAMSDLGSTANLRDELHANGDLGAFHEAFRTYAENELGEGLERLRALSETTVACLICYERRHEECHRATVADLVAEMNDASIVAIG
ncbi:MAG: DUF488 domain-containing protein [Planctomycetota bacterium]